MENLEKETKFYMKKLEKIVVEIKEKFTLLDGYYYVDLEVSDNAVLTVRLLDSAPRKPHLAAVFQPSALAQSIRSRKFLLPIRR